MARLGRKRATLSEFLDYQREALIGRLHGLTVDQAPMTPTGHADIIRETIDGTRGSRHQTQSEPSSGDGPKPCITPGA